VLAPEQKDELTAEAKTTGLEFTLMETVAVAVQEFDPVPVTV
jgi:hypothetical protein